MRALFADDIVFRQPGRNPTSGDYQGIDGILGLLRTLGERSGGTFRSQVHDLLATDEHAVALLRVTAQRADLAVDVPVVHVWHVRDGKLTEAWAHPTDKHLLDQFWAWREDHGIPARVLDELIAISPASAASSTWSASPSGHGKARSWDPAWSAAGCDLCH